MILASKSPRRKVLLASLGYDFTVETSKVEEVFNKQLSVYQAIEEVAWDKVKQLHIEHQDEIVIGADTIIYFDHQIIGKPKNYEDAFNILSKLSNQQHEVISGVCIAYKDQIVKFHEVTKITFKPLDETIIKKYLDMKEYCDKAGAYAIQGAGGQLVSDIEGSYYNVVGLPVERVKKVIENMIQ